MITQKIEGSSAKNIGEIIPHIVQTACAFNSSITFEVDEKHVNAKSIMGVMALASTNAECIQVSVNGADEEAAMKAMIDLLH